jgi:hypothetical protein
MKISIFGLVASFGCIIMCAIFLYWNPYSSTPSNDGTIKTFYTMLILPAFLGIVASFLKNRTSLRHNAVLRFFSQLRSMPLLPQSRPLSTAFTPRRTNASVMSA